MYLQCKGWHVKLVWWLIEQNCAVVSLPQTRFDYSACAAPVVWVCRRNNNKAMQCNIFLSSLTRRCERLLLQNTARRGRSWERTYKHHFFYSLAVWNKVESFSILKYLVILIYFWSSSVLPYNALKMKNGENSINVWRNAELGVHQSPMM